MTPLYLAVVPRRSGWNQLVLHTGVLQSNVKRTEFRIADVLVCKLRSVIRLDRLNLERKYFLKHFEELHRVFRCMLLKPVNKSYSGAFIDCCPLIEMLSVPSRCAFQAVIVLFSLQLDAYMLLVLFCSREVTSLWRFGGLWWFYYTTLRFTSLLFLGHIILARTGSSFWDIFCFEANGFTHDTNSAEEFRQSFLLKNAMIFGMII